MDGWKDGCTDRVEAGRDDGEQLLEVCGGGEAGGGGWIGDSEQKW